MEMGAWYSKDKIMPQIINLSSNLNQTKLCYTYLILNNLYY